MAGDSLYGKTVNIKYYLFGNLSDTLQIKVNVGNITLPLNEKQVNIYTNKTDANTWQILDKDGNAISGARFSSANEEVATVDENGLIYGVADGATTISVVCGEDVLTFEVTVSEALQALPPPSR